MKILVACEESQIVTKAFREKGHEAWSCDIQECSGDLPEYHIQGDVLPLLKKKWDVIIAFPPCTDLSQAQRKDILLEKIKQGKTQNALNFIKKIWNSCDVVCIENPLSWYLNNNWIPYSQIIEPYYFGHNYRKRTCLWLKNLPPLLSTCWNYPEFKKVAGVKKNEKGKALMKRSAKNRSKFHEKVAEAMAEQWTEKIIFNK